MRRLLSILFFSICLLNLYITTNTQAPQQPQLSITVYNSNMAVIKQIRPLTFKQGLQTAYFTDVASQIQPQTVTFKSLTNPSSIQIHQQNYDNNLISKDKILQKYIDKNVDIYVRLGEQSVRYQGKLLGYDGKIVMDSGSGVKEFQGDNVEWISLNGMPDGFFIRPTLSWKLTSTMDQTTSCKISYRTKNINWSTKYTITLNQSPSPSSSFSIEFGSYIQLINNSGKEYKNTKLKLVAGQLNVVQRKPSLPFLIIRAMPGKMASLGTVQDSSLFQERKFADYHVYQLNKVVNISDAQTKSIEFMPKKYNISSDKYYVINVNAGGNPDNQAKVYKWIRFNNSISNKLGIPLTKGTIQVFQYNNHYNEIMYIGSNSISNTPKNQNITLNLGLSPVLACTIQQIDRRTLDGRGGYQANMVLKLSSRNDDYFNVDEESSYVVRFNNIYADNLKIVTWSVYERVSAKLYEWRGKIRRGSSIQMRWQESYNAV